MEICNSMVYQEWVCPRCSGPMDLQDETHHCKRCQLFFSPRFGIPDFRLRAYDSENQLLLARRYLDAWDTLTYEDMVRMRFAGLRERAVAAGKSPSEISNRDEQAHLGSYKTRGRYHRKIVHSTLQYMGQKTRISRLVDVGCGWGRDLLHLATMADQVIGVDVSTFSLLLTKKLLEENNVGNVTLVLAEGQSLPLPTQSVDGINSSATIEHFPVPGDFLRECSRCLGKPGWLFLYYPNRFSVLPETHTGIWGLGFWPKSHQKTIVQKKTGGQWDVTLFSRKGFWHLLKSTFDYEQVCITGIPLGIEEFCHTSKFAEMFPVLAHAARFMLPMVRLIPGLDRVVTSIAPVHFAAVARGHRPYRSMSN